MNHIKKKGKGNLQVQHVKYYIVSGINMLNIR